MPDNSAFTGNVSGLYDRYLGPFLFEPYALDLMDKIRNRNFKSVLELACGTGRVTKHLEETLPDDAHLTATDISPDMIEIAKEKLKGKNIEWNIVDMQNIPFQNSSFDLVLCQFGIMFVPDKVAAYKEIFRVLKSGGKFIFNCWNNLESNKFAVYADKVINSFFPDNPVTFYSIPFSYYDKVVIMEELDKGGFENSSINLVKKEGQSKSSKEAAAGLIEGSPAAIAINERDPKLITVIREKLAEMLSKEFGSNPLKCSLEAYVIESTK